MAEAILGRAMVRRLLVPCCLALLLPGCLGLQGGVLYDYRERRAVPTAGVFVEGFADMDDIGRAKPTYGGRSTVLYRKDTRANVSVQPLVNVPLSETRSKAVWNATFAAGPALRPVGLHTTACARALGTLHYGLCATWLSDGMVGADVNASFFFPMLGGLGSIR